MSGALILGDAERKAIDLAIEAARAQPTPWAVAQDVAIAGKTNTLNLDERRNVERLAAIRRAFPPQVVRLGTYLAALSFEEQPAGLLRHLSVSSARPGTVPHPAVMAMICEAFGFSSFPPTRPHRIWVEEFEPDHRAINVIELEDTSLH